MEVFIWGSYLRWNSSTVGCSEDPGEEHHPWNRPGSTQRGDVRDLVRTARRRHDGKVKSTAGAIGYIELGFVQNDSGTAGVGVVQHAAGKYVAASHAGMDAGYHSLEKNVGADFRASLTNAPGAEAYPIVSFTWLYVPTKANPERANAVVAYIEWALANGQESAERHGYTPLAASLTSKVLAKVRTLG